MEKPKRKKEQPGIMLYFEWLPVLENLSAEQRGELLYSAMLYGAGEEPKIHDIGVSLIWPLIASKIEKDSASYASKCEQNSMKRKYGAYKTKRIEAGQDYMSYSDWLASYNGG